MHLHLHLHLVTVVVLLLILLVHTLTTRQLFHGSIMDSAQLPLSCFSRDLREAMAGVAGGNGGGGSYKGVTVVGAKYGLDTRETGSSPTYVSITLINQSCAGVLQVRARR